MDLKICKDGQDLIQAISSWCESKVRTCKAKSLYLPAGNTPLPIYKSWAENRPSFLSSLQLLQIDDILTGPKAGLFKGFLQSHLSPFQKQFHWIGEKFEQADLGILGLGLNGHVAFHEPSLPKDFYQGCVRLEPPTCQSLQVPEGTWGLTYGASAFLQTKSLLMIVTGNSKRLILQQLLSSKSSLPAAILKSHQDFTLIADDLAANSSFFRKLA